MEQYLDQPLNDDASDEIQIHVATCPACRKRLDDALDPVDAEHWRLLWKIRGDFPFTSDISTVVHERAENAMPPPLTTPIVIDGFEILGVLGRGGSGVVYKAYQTRLDRVVALKMLSAGVHASPRAIARLRAESAMIARLKHPQVVTIHDVGEHQGMPYLCLEYIEGGSLADRWIISR